MLGDDHVASLLGRENDAMCTFFERSFELEEAFNTPHPFASEGPGAAYQGDEICWLRSKLVRELLVV